MRAKLFASVAGMLALVAGVVAHADEERILLPTRPGATELLLVTPAQGAAVASLVLFNGSPGVLFQHDGSGQATALNGQNFLIRSRMAFAAAGFLVASADAPSDHLGGIDEFRSTAAHAQDVAAVIAYLRQRAPVPVWLVGTSMGTISAANAAARLKPGGPDGLVLTSSLTTQTRHSVPVNIAVDVAAITVPTLFIHNKEDNCVAASFGGVAPLMELFKHVPRKELIVVEGGNSPKGDPCAPISRHGYFGIEDEVVGDIARWIKGGEGADVAAQRASKSSTALPDGSSHRICLPPGPSRISLRNATPRWRRVATSPARSSTSSTKRFQPPGSGLRPSGMGFEAEAAGPASQSVRSARARIAMAGPNCCLSSKPSAPV
jgi:pimeloyl-ACP methyl ester carboxylesterase